MRTGIDDIMISHEHDIISSLPMLSTIQTWMVPLHGQDQQNSNLPHRYSCQQCMAPLSVGCGKLTAVAAYCSTQGAIGFCICGDVIESCIDLQAECRQFDLAERLKSLPCSPQGASYESGGSAWSWTPK